MASLFSDASHETVTSVLPAYLASMGAAAAALGAIEGIADGLSSLAKLYGGWLADRVQRRKIVCASGYSVMALAPLIIAAALSWPIVLVGRVVAWISRGVRTPARKALLAEAVTPETRGRAFGFERAMDTTGAIIAPLMVLALMRAGFSHREVIYFSVIPAVLAVLGIVFFVRETPGRIPNKRPFLKSFTGFDPQFKEFLFAVGLFGVGDFARTFYMLYAVAVLTPAIGAARAATISVALYAFHNVLYAIWSYLGGWIADHFNKRLLLAIGYTSVAASALCMTIGTDSYAGLMVVFALGGTGIGIHEAIEDVIAAELLPAEIRGSGFGILAVVTGMADLISSATVGWLWFALGSKIAFLAAATVMFAGVVLMLHLARKNEQDDQ